MGHLPPLTVGNRAVDIQKSLQDIMISAPHYYFDKTILIGKAARIAANIRGFNYLKPSQLDIMSVELGIAPLEVRDVILPRLEELNVVRLIKGHTGKLERVEEKVPRVASLIEELGKYMQELEPNPIETSGIEALHVATFKPIEKTELRTQLTELKDEEFEILLDCGKTGRFLDEYTAPNGGETQVYSPLIWNEKSEEVMKMYTSLSENQKDELVRILSSINSYPGTPIEKLCTLNQPLLGQAIRTGILEKCSVATKKGTKDYLFMPNPKFRIKSEGVKQCDLFDKTKIILSCIRHGQHYAEITKILYPDKVLQKLLDKGYLNPHSEFKEQYALLELHGIAKIEPASGNRYYLKLIDTDENRQAIEAATDVLSHTREAVTAHVVDTQARALLISGNFVNPARNRARIKELPTLTYKTLQSMLEKLRGESIE
jgi:hypothetical protein